MRTWGSLALAVLFAALAIFVVLSNDQEVFLVLPGFQWKTKLWGAMVASASAGAAVTALFVSWPLLRAKMLSRRHSRRIAELEQEVHGLRTLPIASDSATSSSVQKG